MSKLYAQIYTDSGHGGGSITTRTGHKEITVLAQTHDGAVVVTLDRDGNYVVTVTDATLKGQYPSGGSFARAKGNVKDRG